MVKLNWHNLATQLQFTHHLFSKYPRCATKPLSQSSGASHCCAVQCFCSDVEDTIGEPNSTKCTYKCSGNDAETCGGSSAITIYKKLGVSPTPAPAEQGYIGCYGDAAQRIMVLQSESKQGMTTQVSNNSVSILFMYIQLILTKNTLCLVRDSPHCPSNILRRLAVDTTLGFDFCRS